jgi:PHD/YefM family antitoxin component YafN of YafNO toxin-antitoxin module
MPNTLQYITDDKGKKTAVVIPLNEYEKLMEDLDDLTVIADRRGEPTISHEKFKAELKRNGLLSN